MRRRRCCRRPSASIPWDDSHHPELSQTDGVPDGRWLFINGNNTPRVARIDLTRFETDEILEIPNAAGGHASPFTTPNTKYIVSATRFSVPMGANKDVAINTYKQNFKGTLSFITADQPGKMDIAFQILMPGYNYDLGHAGKGPSEGWFFFTSYNTEQAYTKLEVNASQNDKDYVAAVNYKKAEECVAAGKAKTVPAHVHAQLHRPEVTHRHGREEDQCEDDRPARLRRHRVLPADAQVATRRRRRSDGRIHRRRRQARDGHSRALLHEAREGDRGEAVRDHDRRDPGSQVRRDPRRRSTEARPRPAAHRVRRQGQRVHLDVHQLRSREVEARDVGSASIACRSTTRSATS